LVSSADPRITTPGRTTEQRKRIATGLKFRSLKVTIASGRPLIAVSNTISGSGCIGRVRITNSTLFPGCHGKLSGWGFDDPRLDTLFLAMPISWRGTLQQYVGRLHRLNENKKEVQVFDYADVQVPMLARIYKKRLAGYAALGYSIANK
jgi:hypothetical protein